MNRSSRRQPCSIATTCCSCLSGTSREIVEASETIKHENDLRRTRSRETRLDRQHKGLEPPPTPPMSGKYTRAAK